MGYEWERVTVGGEGVEYCSPEAPRHRRQRGGSSRRLGGLRRARRQSTAPIARVAHGACSTLGLRLPGAKPAWRDGVLAQVANLSPLHLRPCSPVTSLPR